MSGPPHRASSAKIKREPKGYQSIKPHHEPTVVTQRDLNKGIFHCVQRGLIPHHADVSLAFTENGRLPPLCVEPILFHHPSETLERREVLTLDHGLSAVTAKLDLANPVVKTHPKMYQPKPQLAQYGPESHGALGPNASDAEKKVASLISDLGKKTRDPTRTYQDLLDMYSLHEFIIRRGKTLSSTPEFLSYQRSFPKEWAGIQLVIKALEELLLEYAIPLAYIDGKKVAALSVRKMKGYTNDELVECIANRDEVLPLINKPHRSAKLTKAATTIQATFRMYRQRCRYLDLCYRNECAKIIQKMWHSHRRHSNTRSLILQHQFEVEDAWRQLQEQFIKDWDVIVTRPRVIIHVPSLSYTEQQVKSMPYLGVQQNGQMARYVSIFAVPCQVPSSSSRTYEYHGPTLVA